jgi:hypothetical protein
MIEYFLTKTNENEDAAVGWKKDVDYFRVDGKTLPKDRAQYCANFNDPKNRRLASTRRMNI